MIKYANIKISCYSVKILAIALIISISFDPIVYGLATLPASQNPAAKREILAALERTRIRYAESEDAVRLLKTNNAECLLLSSGKYLVSKDAARDDLKLLRNIIHLDIEAVMQIMEKNDRTRYGDIKRLILKYFPQDRDNTLPMGLYVNSTVARAFEWLSLVKEGIISKLDIPPQEMQFINDIEPIINANRHNYFTGEFWDPHLRGARIRKALNDGMRFYQVAASTTDDKSAAPQQAGKPMQNDSAAVDKIYGWYRNMTLQEHEDELNGLGTTSLEIKNTLKNLIRQRFLKLLKTIPDRGIKFIGAGETFIVFEIADSGLVIKIPVLGREYFGYVERGLRDLRLNLGDHLAGTVEYLDDFKINFNKLDDRGREIVIQGIGDDALNMKRTTDNKAYIDHEGNIHVNWMLIQREADRLVVSDNFFFDPEYYFGALETAFRTSGKEGVKRIIDDLAELLKASAYPRGVYPREIKFSSFGYVGDRLVLFDTDMGDREAPFKGMFTIGILDKLDPVGELSEYFVEKMSAPAANINPIPVLSEDLDFIVDGEDTPSAQKKAIRALIEDRAKNPPYSIANDFAAIVRSGIAPRSALTKVLEEFGISLRAESTPEDSLLFSVVAEALSVLPADVLKEMASKGLREIEIAEPEAGKRPVSSRGGAVMISRDSMKGQSANMALEDLYKILGAIFISTLDPAKAAGLNRDFESINQRGEYIREASAAKGYDFIETKEGEAFGDYMSRVFSYYLLKGNDLRKLVNGDIAYHEPYDVIRPNVRRVYDAFKIAFDWKEYGSSDLRGLTAALEKYRNETDGRVSAEPRVADDDPFDAGSSTVLISDLLYAQLNEGRSYEIRYDAAKLSGSQIAVIEDYVKLLRSRSASPGNFKLKPFSSSQGSKESLIAVYCTGADFRGVGKVDVSLQDGQICDYLLKITGMLNIALASSNIPDTLSRDDIDSYRPILAFISNQYKAILGEDLIMPDTPDDILKAIRVIVLGLPRSMRMNTGQIEEFNRLSRQALSAA